MTRRINSVYGRTQYHSVNLSVAPKEEEEELSLAEPGFKGSKALTSLSQAHGFVVIPSQVDLVESGSEVEVHLF